MSENTEFAYQEMFPLAPEDTPWRKLTSEHVSTIEVDGPEIPIMDGSADSFLHLIRAAGLYEQHETQTVLDIRRTIEVVNGERRICIEPARHLAISYAVDFAHPAIRRQTLHLDSVEPESFEREVAGARTFGFLEEVEALRAE